MSSCFVFYCSCAHSLLHSFPTRRSSDLLLSNNQRIAGEPPLPVAVAQHGHGMPAGQAIVVDRKSTRLNSSHQIISYAVFCLKKKKTTPDNRNLAKHPQADHTKYSDPHDS